MNSKRFFAELKRRNVYRAAVAYAMTAWLLAQIATQISPFFEIPNAAVRFVIVLLIVGFPIAMLLAWLYEFTPEGIVRAEDLQSTEVRSIQRRTGRILDFVIIGILLLVMRCYSSSAVRGECRRVEQSVKKASRCCLLKI